MATTRSPTRPDAPAAALPLPWLAAPLAAALRTQHGHALLVHGPRGIGQFELAMALAEAWLCESETRQPDQPACGHCAACSLLRARTHPDLRVIVPDAERERLGWQGSADAEEGTGDKAGRKKPSKEIRIEAIRDAIAFTSTSSARGRGKVVLIHPAERMNVVAANALLKTLEEPPGAARLLLSSAAADELLPTIRSRCEALAVRIPATVVASDWLAGQGVAQPEVLLAACGGQPEEALAWARQGLDAASWRGLPARVAAGDASTLRGWPLPMAVDALQKLCHDALAIACSAPPRYFPAAALGVGARLVSLLAWARELKRVARDVEHPWNVELTLETLVEQGRQALNTPRSRGGAARTRSLHSER
ncbi:MAG: DNA polymerase III subunit delta' [Caldimonas sp.]